MANVVLVIDMLRGFMEEGCPLYCGVEAREIIPNIQELLEREQAQGSIWVKSGIMVGLGESNEQVLATLQDLHRVGCDVVTIGQYLQADVRKLRVKAFVTPEQFSEYATFGENLGIKHVYSGPFVRSSYNALEVMNRVMK